jgi:hypothetical protein
VGALIGIALSCFLIIRQNILEKSFINLVFFILLLIFIITGNKNPRFTIMKHKRKYRELEKSVREKISLANKGKSKSLSHRLHLSQSLKRYWDSVPSKPQDMSMQEYNTEEPVRKNNDVQPSNTNEQ